MSIGQEAFHRNTQELADILEKKMNVSVYTESFLADNNHLFCLARTPSGNKIFTASPDENNPALADPGNRIISTWEYPIIFEYPLSPENASRLRNRFSFLSPSVIGLDSSAGFGDRLGCATPGHVRAIMNTPGGSKFFRPVFAQQSTRENLRTGRSSSEVIDDAMWGIMQSGWKGGYGADADHLKTTGEISECYKNGYTFFTIDPGDHVKNIDSGSDRNLLQEGLDNLPWERLETSWADLRARFLDKPFSFENISVTFNQEILAVAAVKYGSAVAHTVSMYRHLLEISNENRESFELEVSVDETDSPTSLEEHIFVATELKRLGVVWNSLAPRFPGRFEKGVDYQSEETDTIENSLTVLKKSFIEHAAAARAFGPYKLSLHSGSDKFLAYPLLADAAGSLVHVKTAGTSYLEALKVAAVKAPDFFRNVHEYALSRYSEDKASYHVSASLERASNTLKMKNSELIKTFDSLDDRQILHVTFGSVLNEPVLKKELLQVLNCWEEQYYDFL
ncbi:MAG: hypothetical protein KAH12_11245, partial [Anaerolineales bacterium]|nr:hypothetical protein [Anaerolineales bacterium]